MLSKLMEHRFGVFGDEPIHAYIYAAPRLSLYMLASRRAEGSPSAGMTAELPL